VSRRPSARVGRRCVAPLWLTVRRVRARPGRTLLVSLGVTVAVGFLVGVTGGSLVSEDLALRQALGSLPPVERVVRVSWSGQVAAGGYAALDRVARRALRTLTAGPIRASLELADVQLGSGLVKLGAVDSLDGVVHLRSGRLPSGCGPSRCEVVEVGGRPLERIDGFGVHLVVVGRGTLTSRVPFGEGGLSTQPGSDGERPEPVLLTAGIRGLATLPPLRVFSRSYGWSAQLAPVAVHVWEIGRLLTAEGRAQAGLAAADGQFLLTAPDEALSSAQGQGQIASRRVFLVGGAAAMLLLAFAGVTAGAVRRDVRGELSRLATRGAARSQQWAFLFAEAIAAVLPGLLAGLLVGVGAVALLARRESVPVAGALVHGLIGWAPLVLVTAGAIGAVAAVLVALRAPEPRRARGLRVADMAALGAVVALVLLLVSGQGAAGSLGAGPAVSLAFVPLLASFSFCVVLGRLLEPALRVAVRAARNAPSSLHLGLLALHRSPSRTIGIAGFLAAATGLAVFALSYRETLAASAAERAAYAVPLDYTLGVGSALVAPRDAAPLARYRSLAPGVSAWPVLRQVAEVAGANGTPITPNVIGVPSDALRLLHGWRSDFSSESPAELGRLLRPHGPVGLVGATIPSAATSLELRASVVGAVVQPVLVVLTRDGGADQLLPPPATTRGAVLGVSVPAADRGGRIIAFQLQLPAAVQRSSAHQAAEGHSSEPGYEGTLRLGPLIALTRGRAVEVTDFAGWVGRAGVTPRRAGHGLRVGYLITTSEQALLRPPQPFDGRRLPVVASPDVAATAGPGGAVELDFGDQVVHARLVAVAHRFPTTQDSGESFVVADEASLASAVGSNDLPTAIPDELWLSAPVASTARLALALSAPPYADLAISSRAEIEQSLRDDPLARGIVTSLIAAAAAALVLSLVGLALVVAGFAHDEGDALFDLESQGLGPRALRAFVRWRAFGLAAVGLLAGIVLGSGLAAATETLLALDATLTTPDPPLRRATPWLMIGVSALALVLVAGVLIELVLRLAHRRAAAGRGRTGEYWAM
jgi:hypothetical protein